MEFMNATETNYDVCEEIIEILHKNGVSVAQSGAIFNFVKRKIAQDTKVGELVKFDHEDL